MSPAEPAAPAAFDIVSCGPAERAEQTRLFNACFRKSLEASALEWRYDRNPHGRAVSLVARPSGEAGHDGVSGYACSPRLALARGDEATLAPIGQTGDVMTHPDWRKRGIFSDLDRRAMAETRDLGWPLVFGLPNRRSAHIFLTLGWEQVGRIRPWTFCLRVSREARAVRRVDGRWRALRLPAARRRGAAARRRLRAASEGRFGVRRIERFDAAVDALSREVEPRFALMVRRDHAYLNWRFIDTTTGLHTPLGVYDAAGELCGYVIVQRPREGEVVGYLVDVLARDEAALAQALEAELAQLEATGAELVQATAVDDSWWEAELRRAGFEPPRAENHLIVIVHLHDPAHPLARAARDASGWYLTDGDRDDETMG